MGRVTIRVLVVDDYKAWREFAAKTLEKKPDLTLVGEASAGSEAVRKAKELEPDLILLDVGLPLLNGIDAAKRIGEVSPASKILIVSENRVPEIVEAALSIPVSGYVLKSDAGSDLLPAIEAVLQGRQFVSPRLSGGSSATHNIEGSEGGQRPGIE